MPLLSEDELATIKDMKAIVQLIESEDLKSLCVNLLTRLDRVKTISERPYTRNTSAKAKDEFQKCLTEYIRLMQLKTQAFKK